VPVLETGLERAVLLAESMDARGFGRSRAGRRHLIAGWLGLVGLVGLCGAMVALVGRSTGVALACLLGGAAALVAALLLAGADERFTRYRVRPLTGLDAVVMAVVAAAPVGLAICSAAGESTLHWVIGIAPTLPTFGPLPALCLLLLAAPALVPSSRAAPEAGVVATEPAAAGAVA
jgi:energy-coupling factor transport system permease protein